jgi:hypothetical protein
MTRTLLQKILLTAAIAAALTGSALAQMPMPSISLGGDKPPPTPEQLEKQKIIDKAYRSATQKIPDKKPVDPWGNVRPSPATASQKASQNK